MSRRAHTGEGGPRARRDPWPLLFEATLEAVVEPDRRFRGSLVHGLEQTIQLVSPALDLRDAYDCGHQNHVCTLAVAIAHETGLPESEAGEVKVAAIVRDIGKLKVPPRILGRPGKLSEIEFRIVQGHARAGWEVLKDITFPWAVADIVWQHHERQDGSGYPRGLRGDEILPGARVVAVADALAAMVSHRPYRPALGMDAALAEIRRGRGKIFDADVVDACLRLCRNNPSPFLA